MRSRISRLVRSIGRRHLQFAALAFGAVAFAACSARSLGVEPATSPPATATAVATVPRSPGEGERLFKLRCGMCHAVERGKASLVGPTLSGVVGRPAGSVGAFAYSKALREFGQAWTEANLDRFLQNPSAWVAGNRMAFAGMGDASQRQAIIEYLKANP